MLALRARGFALRNAFADALRGLITAEEAQDYTPATAPQGLTVSHVERFSEPVTTEPAQQSTATADDMVKARHYVQGATQAQLERMAGIVETRLKSGFYTPAQADELLNLVNGRIDILTSTPEEVGA